jgi:hypothetical protein
VLLTITLTKTPATDLGYLLHDEVAAGIAWWEDLTSRGGEGMVVKPLDFIPPRGDDASEGRNRRRAGC